MSKRCPSTNWCSLTGAKWWRNRSVTGRARFSAYHSPTASIKSTVACQAFAKTQQPLGSGVALGSTDHLLVECGQQDASMFHTAHLYAETLESATRVLCVPCPLLTSTGSGITSAHGMLSSPTSTFCFQASAVQLEVRSYPDKSALRSLAGQCFKNPIHAGLRAATPPDLQRHRRKASGVQPPVRKPCKHPCSHARDIS